MRQFGIPLSIIASHFLAEETVVTCEEVKAGNAGGNSWAEIAMSTP